MSIDKSSRGLNLIKLFLGNQCAFNLLRSREAFGMPQPQTMEGRTLRIKVISMGNANVGKSCLIKRYCEKRFVSKYLTTIGIDYGLTKAQVKNRDVKVHIFDMAGSLMFFEVRNEFYKDTQGALLVFDVTDRDSFESLDRWLNEMRSEMGSAEDMSRVYFVVCANKMDKKRVVNEAEGRLWAHQQGMAYVEASALNGDGVNELFQMLFEGVLATVDNDGKPPQITAELGFTREQVEHIQRILRARDNCERLGVQPGASKDEINKAFRKLAVLLHPDKNVAPGSEEAFKMLVSAHDALTR